MFLYIIIFPYVQRLNIQLMSVFHFLLNKSLGSFYKGDRDAYINVLNKA